MKLIICGGRNYTDINKLNEVLNKLHEQNQINKIVTGDAKGADSMAVNWAKKHDIEYEIYKADWNLNGKAAGPIRNQKMISENSDADYLIAFPGGNGTKNAISTAMRYNVKVITIGE